MKIGGYQILDLYNYTFTVGTGQKVSGSHDLIKAIKGKPINTSRINIAGTVYPASYVSFVPDGTSFKATYGDKTITIAADDTVTISNGIVGGGGTQVQANWDESDTEDPSYIQNKPTIPAAQVQADWDETDDSDPSYIQNKPTIPAAQVQKYNTTGLTAVKCPKPIFKDWYNKTWSALVSFAAENIWTDGNSIYYSNSTSQYVLNVAASTWSNKTWTGLTSFNADIWTDGINIYYSNGESQYVLDIATSTWSTKTWTGLTSFNATYVWTDGINIYYSRGISQYVLDVATLTWSTKTWTGISSFYGYRVWTDGISTYYSDATEQYVLNRR